MKLITKSAIIGVQANQSVYGMRVQNKFTSKRSLFYRLNENILNGKTVLLYKQNFVILMEPNLVFPNNGVTRKLFILYLFLDDIKSNIDNNTPN